MAIRSKKSTSTPRFDDSFIVRKNSSQTLRISNVRTPKTAAVSRRFTTQNGLKGINEPRIYSYT
jgi:hypothetical protein